MEQTITTWFIKPSTNYDRLNHHQWEDLLTYILVAIDATGIQYCLRSTATLPRSPSAWSHPPQSAQQQQQQQQQQRLLLPTLVQVEGLDNCKGIHNSPWKSKSVQHGHLPSLLGQLACTRTHARAHTHQYKNMRHSLYNTISISQFLCTKMIYYTHAETYRGTEVTLCLISLVHKVWYNKYICNLINCQPECESWGKQWLGLDIQVADNSWRSDSECNRLDQYGEVTHSKHMSSEENKYNMTLPWGYMRK